MTASQFREILADALIGAAGAIRGRIPETGSPIRRTAPEEAKVITSGRLALNVNEVAEALGISRSTVFLLISSGQLPSFQIGKRRLISVQAITDLIHGHSPSAPTDNLDTP
jgi:excisionase family DNA binding protein